MVRGALCLFAALLPSFAWAVDPVRVPRRVARELAGDWKGADDATYRIVAAGRMVSVEDPIDADGERFTIQAVDYVGRRLQWTYLVPSTGYVVTMRVEDASNDTLEISWTNQKTSGVEVITRRTE